MFSPLEEYSKVSRTLQVRQFLLVESEKKSSFMLNSYLDLVMCINVFLGTGNS